MTKRFGKRGVFIVFIFITSTAIIRILYDRSVIIRRLTSTYKSANSNLFTNGPIRDTDGRHQQIYQQEYESCDNYLRHNHTNKSSNHIALNEDRYLHNNVTEHVNLAIVAGMRTGSSFLGQFFNFNPDFFYMHEPLRPLSKSGLLEREDPTIGISILHNIYQCYFASNITIAYFKNYYPILEKQPQNCAHQQLHVKSAEQCCKSSKHIASKVIRILDVRYFFPLMQNPTINLKVIVIVRDPRAMVASLMVRYDPVAWKIPQSKTIFGIFDEYLLLRVTYYCDVMKHNFDYFRAMEFPWKHNFLMIRFEDLALSPSNLALDMYEFLGLGNVPLEIEHWINDNTNSNSRPDVNYYGTQRNSSEVVNHWQQVLNSSLIWLIQNITECYSLMTQLNYGMIDDVIDVTTNGN
ncbi:carbohydrate sulfotransferase 3-like [Glandiceps talaboti]